MSSYRFGPRFAATVAALCVFAVGCGSSGETADSTTTSSGDSTGTTTDAPSSGSIVVDHRFGSTEIDGTPERIVSLDPQWTDVLLSLEVQPVGFITHTYQSEPTFPWQGNDLDDVTQILYSDSIPFEEVAALAPDLIVGTFAIEDQSQYDMLNEIAPTIASLNDTEVQRWQDIATTAGEIFDLGDHADELIAEVDGLGASIGAELPGLSGKTFSFFNYFQGDFVLLTDPEDGANVLFQQLGLQMPEAVKAEDTGNGRLTVSAERIDLLEADLVVVLSNGSDMSSVAGWSGLAAVQAGHVIDMDMDLAVAINTPTPLSIPWALEQIRPALDALANA